MTISEFEGDMPDPCIGFNGLAGVDGRDDVGTGAPPFSHGRPGPA
ncbi:MAG: hypothetical protein PVJ74_08660 [Gammaproteobacteria bacterium]